MPGIFGSSARFGLASFAGGEPFLQTLDASLCLPLAHACTCKSQTHARVTSQPANADRETLTLGTAAPRGGQHNHRGNRIADSQQPCQRNVQQCLLHTKQTRSPERASVPFPCFSAGSRRTRSASLKPKGRTMPYLARRIRHLVPIWQPYIRSSFHFCAQKTNGGTKQRSRPTDELPFRGVGRVLRRGEPRLQVRCAARLGRRLLSEPHRFTLPVLRHRLCRL
jgi:hypothetical protein